MIPRDLVVACDDQRARLAAVRDGIEQQHVGGVEQQRHEREAERAAVEHLDVRGEVPAVAEGFHATHAEAFVGPENVADAEHDDAARGD